LKGEIDRLIKLLQEKQQVEQGVHIFVRGEGSRSRGWEEIQVQQAGLFADRATELPKIQEEEEEYEQNEGDKDKEEDQTKANIKSKKAFSMAINDKTMPPPIKRLFRFSEFILAALIAYAITEYAILYTHYNNTKENFSLLENSYLRAAELQKVAYNARTLVLLS